MRWPLMGETITLADRLKMASFIMTTTRFTNGEKVRKFEKNWNNWLGSKYSLFVSSGSTANFLLVAAIMEKYNLKRGDEVLLPACTWMTNVAPCLQLGLKPVFCDVNLQNYSFDIASARIVAKNNNIKLIFVSHLLGFSGQIETLQHIFPRAIVIEDTCESHGCINYFGDHSKRGANSLGSTYSFYFGHHMSTIEGGMVSTYDEDLYDLMKMKRSHGLARESINFADHAINNPHIDRQFLFMTDGYNFRNHEVAAVLGISQLKRLDKMIKQRRENYKDYTRIINSHSNLFREHRYDPGNSSFCFPFICKTPEIMEKMKTAFRKNNVEFRPIVSGNLLDQPFLRGKYPLTSAITTPNVHLLQKQGVYIGNSHFVGKKHMKLLEEIVKEIK